MDNTVSYITACGKLLGKTGSNYGPVARDVYILHYVISGRGFLDFGDKHITIEKGQSFMIRPFLSVHYYSDPEDPWEYVWVDFRGHEFEYLINSINYIKDNCVIGYTDPRYILLLIDMICGEYPLKKTTNFCNGLLKAILGIYIDNFPTTDGNARAQKFSDATKEISENFQNFDFTITDISTALGISAASLYRLFIEFAGISPNRYLTSYRITMAKNFIDAGMTIKAAAQACGYSDPLYFSRVFKSIVTISPTAYRQRNPNIDCRKETYIFE